MANKSGPADRRTRINPRKIEHPYRHFEDSRLWAKINQAIEDLVQNGDIRETTHRDYIVGYLCKMIDDSHGE